MKNAVVAVFVVLVAVSMSVGQDCNTIKSGQITDVKNNPVTLGYDKYGYNYQAHMFNGLYANYTRPTTPETTGSINLIMKWSDEWISNLDCNSDKKLDRGLDLKAGLNTGLSRGWLTNHMEGECTNPTTGELEHFTYFSKMVWVDEAPVGQPDPWEGKRIWGVYAIIEEVSNNAPTDDNLQYCSGNHGTLRSLLANPAGFGFYTN